MDDMDMDMSMDSSPSTSTSTSSTPARSLGSRPRAQLRPARSLSSLRLEALGGLRFAREGAASAGESSFDRLIQTTHNMHIHSWTRTGAGVTVDDGVRRDRNAHDKHNHQHHHHTPARVETATPTGPDWTQAQLMQIQTPKRARALSTASTSTLDGPSPSHTYRRKSFTDDDYRYYFQTPPRVRSSSTPGRRKQRHYPDQDQDQRATPERAARDDSSSPDSTPRSSISIDRDTEEGGDCVTEAGQIIGVAGGAVASSGQGEPMDSEYSSLEQMLARRGFHGKECRVTTPDSVKFTITTMPGVAGQAQSKWHPPAPSSGAVPIPNAPQGEALEAQMQAHPHPHERIGAGGKSAAMATREGGASLSLRTKHSLLALGGLIGTLSLWPNTSTVSSSPFPPPATSAHVPALQMKTDEEQQQQQQPPPSPTPSAESDTAELSFDRCENITKWVREAAASTEPPRQQPCTRAATEDAVQPLIVQSMTSSRPEKDVQALFDAYKHNPDSPTLLDFGFDKPVLGPADTSTGGSTKSPRHTFSDPGPGSTVAPVLMSIVAPVPPVAGAAAARRSSHPTLANIFGPPLPLSSINANDLEHAVQCPPPSPSTPLPALTSRTSCTSSGTSASASTSTSGIAVDEPKRPAPAARPEPKLLRKTASQHTLRMAASPVLSTDEALSLSASSSSSSDPRERGRAPTPPPLPVSASASVSPRGPAPPSRGAKAAASSLDSPVRPRNDRTVSEPVLGGTPPFARVYPRHVAHRNPRDSPVGETRVVKGGSSRSFVTGADENSSGTPVKKASANARKPPSILDDGDDADGLWTPPRGSSRSGPTRTRQALASAPGNSGTTTTAASTSAERPRLRAKESLEHILAKREMAVTRNPQPVPAVPALPSTAPTKTKAQTSAKTQTQQQQQQHVEGESSAQKQKHQQTLAGRKALGQLSTFHRNPLPPAKAGQLDTITKGTQGSKGGFSRKEGSSAHGGKENEPAVSAPTSSLTGTLKGLFGSWGMTSSPAPSPSLGAAGNASKSKSGHASNTRSATEPRRPGPAPGRRHKQHGSDSSAYTSGEREHRYGSAAAMLLPTIVVSDASSDYEDGVRL